MPLDHNALAKMAKEEASDPVEIHDDPVPARASHSSAPTSSSAPWAVLLQLMREHQKSLKNLTTLVCRVADRVGVEATPFLGEDVAPGKEPQMQEEAQGAEIAEQGVQAEFHADQKEEEHPDKESEDVQEVGTAQEGDKQQDKTVEEEEIRDADHRVVDSVVDRLLAAHKEAALREQEEEAAKEAEKERLAQEAEEQERVRSEKAELARKLAEEERLAREAEEQERARTEEEERLAALEAKQAEEEEHALQEQLAHQKAAAEAAAKALQEAADRAAAATARRLAAAKLTAEKRRAAASPAIPKESSSATPTPLQESTVPTPPSAPVVQVPTMRLHSGEKVPLKVMTTAGGRRKALAHRCPSSTYMLPKQPARVTRAAAKASSARAAPKVSEAASSDKDSDSSPEPSKSHISFSTEDSDEYEPADRNSVGSDDSAGSD